MKYTAFGITISSDIDFSDMLQPADNEVNLTISKGHVNNGNWQLTKVYRKGLQAEVAIENDTVKLLWPGLVICEVTAGKSIVYQHLGDDIQTLKLFLLSEVIGIILIQRGLFLLHGSAIGIAHRAHVFVGEPGAGKSSTAAAFWKAGLEVMTDDLVAIDTSGEVPVVLPAFPQFKIWKQTVDGLEIDNKILRPAFEGRDKFLIHQDFNSFGKAKIPLKSIQILNFDSNERIDVLASPTELLKHFPLPHQLLQGQFIKNHFKNAVEIAQNVEIRFLIRPNGFEQLKQFTREFKTK